jgi:hypothetical protein
VADKEQESVSEEKGDWKTKRTFWCECNTEKITKEFDGNIMMFFNAIVWCVIRSRGMRKVRWVRWIYRVPYNFMAHRLRT